MSRMIVNGMDKDWSRLIVVYGLSEDQVKEVEKAVKGHEVFSTDCFTDTIALPQMASITVWNDVSKKDKEFFIEYYTDVEPFAETVILIGDIDDKEVVIPGSLKKQLSIYPSYEEFKPKMKYEILNARKKTEKNYSYSKTISMALTILKLIRQKPNITTREIAEHWSVEQSERSVQRYIKTLKMAGEAIYYDAKNNGWSLQCDGMSLLSGEVFEKSDQ